jgi:hypothetical protein
MSVRTGVFCTVCVMILLGACNLVPDGVPSLPLAYMELPFLDLVLHELDPALLTTQGKLGCSLSDLPPFRWKEVNSGMVDIRDPEAYRIQVESLYQEGFLAYEFNRSEYPDVHPSLPDMSYEEFLETCNVFPEVDFTKYTLLGYHLNGTGCTVNFEKHVYRDDREEKVIYEISVHQEGACEMAIYDRNLILIPKIPSDFRVDFAISGMNP